MRLGFFSRSSTPASRRFMPMPSYSCVKLNFEGMQCIVMLVDACRHEHRRRASPAPTPEDSARIIPGGPRVSNNASARLSSSDGNPFTVNELVQFVPPAGSDLISPVISMQNPLVAGFAHGLRDGDRLMAGVHILIIDRRLGAVDDVEGVSGLVSRRESPPGAVVAAGRAGRAPVAASPPRPPANTHSRWPDSLSGTGVWAS